MTKTAVSVARNCGMVGPNDHVIIVNGFAPDKDGPARLEWERAEMPREESSEYSDQEVGITWVKVFRILRPTFHSKSASKC